MKRLLAAVLLAGAVIAQSPTAIGDSDTGLGNFNSNALLDTSQVELGQAISTPEPIPTQTTTTCDDPCKVGQE